MHELQGSRKQRGGVFEVLDCYDIALDAIDFVVDRMGFDTGADPQDLLDHLVETVSRWAPEAGPAEATSAATAINEVLIRPQRGAYSRPDHPTRRPFDFALLREEPSPDGVRVTATNEAINVLVGALDTDVASAHSAADAKLASLIARRRFPEAEQAAREARIRSIQYMTEVRRIIADTRLDVRRAGWEDRVPAQLEEMTTHLSEQMDVEKRMLEAMRDARDVAEDPESVASAHELVHVVEECFNRHRDLHNRLLEVSETFFTEYARQAFVPQLSLRAVDIYAELFAPVVAMTAGDATPSIERFASASWGCADLRLASMNRLFEVLLADPRAIDGLGEELPDEEFAFDEDPRRFASESWAAADAFLAEVTHPVRLSRLMAAARESADDEVSELVALHALQAADPALDELRRGESVLATADDGEVLDDAIFEGADLLVGRLVPDREALGLEMS